VLPDPASFHKIRKRRENVLIFLLSLTLLVMAAGALWYLLLQPGKLEQQAAAPSSSPAGMPDAPSLANGPVKPAEQIQQPASPVVPVPQQVAPPQPSVAPSLAPATQQAASQPRPPSPATSAPQLASAIREPEMKEIHAGSFTMGSNDDATEKPTHQVTIKPFAISQHPITVREWNECAAAQACAFVANGKDDAPVTNVSWSDAKQYVAWLSAAARKAYRLPSEAEWEYAARGGTQTKYWWGDQFQFGMANCRNCSDIAAAEQPVKVGSFKPNPFGLHDMGGGVDQWVEDCWHKNYQGAPADGSAGSANASRHSSVPGKNDAQYVRPSNCGVGINVRYPTHGSVSH
jgi:formylglycine-generating enzyme required for sulfatase activity